MPKVLPASSSGGGHRARGRRVSTTLAEINVIPLVDVMLVLLIIFMVAAPLLTVGIPIELPKTAAAPLPTENEEPLTIALTEDGLIIVQNETIERGQLIPLLRAVAEERKSDKIFLRADGSIPYEGVMQVMGALNASGFNDIGLVTEQGGPTFDSEDAGQDG